MNHKLINLLAACIVWLFVCGTPAFAQANPSKCVSKITERLEALGQTAEFDFLKAREIMKDFDYGKISAAVSDPGKASAFKKTFTSLSEFCDLCGTSLSGKGMKGYTKQSGLLINSSDLAKTEDNIAKLKEAFTQGGSFKSADFDGVMSKLGDESKFDFDGASGTFASKASGAKYAKHPTGYAQGEPDSVTHIMRGHTSNAFTDGLTGQKSIFADATKIFELIDEAMNAPAANRIPQSGGFFVDLGKTVGKNNASPPADSARIFIFLRPGTMDVIHTAFPY